MEPAGLNSPELLSRKNDALAVVMRLREAGHVAYFAGGSVRDLLLGVQPKDYDIATDAPPLRVRQLFRNTQAVGAAFGVILVREGGSQIEVATFRADLSYTDGRRPKGIRFTTPEEDARRRDFTINGLFLDPLDERIIDYVGGQEDLKNRVLRAIGQPHERFGEDHLRVLRAIRFAARFSLQIEASTAAAMQAHGPHLTRVSPERVAGELRLMLSPPSRTWAAELLWRFKLPQVTFRTLPDRPDRADHSILPLINTQESISFPLALAGLLIDYQRGDTDESLVSLFSRREINRAVQACRTTLKISNDESDQLAGILQLEAILSSSSLGVATAKRFLASPFAADARLLIDALQRGGLFQKTIPAAQATLAACEKEDVAPKALITGDDLVSIGLRPGKEFKQLLDQLYDAQLEGVVATKEQAFQRLRSMVQTTTAN